MATTVLVEVTRAELYVRADLPKPARTCRESTVEGLEQCLTSGRLEDVSVTSWSKRVPIDSGETLERTCYDRFSAWADDHGVRLGPSWGTRECYSPETGERRRELVTPVLCLALYDADDELVCVAPHADGTNTVTVVECLDRLLRTTDDEDDATVLEAAD